MDQTKLVIGNQLGTKLSLHRKQAVQDLLPCLDGEWPRDMLARYVEGQAAIAPDGAALGLVITKGDEPIAEGNERLVGVLAGIDKALEALVLLDDRAGPAAKATVLGSAARRLVFAQDHGALATFGISIELEQLRRRAAPRCVE